MRKLYLINGVVKLRMLFIVLHGHLFVAQFSIEIRHRGEIQVHEHVQVDRQNFICSNGIFSI